MTGESSGRIIAGEFGPRVSHLPPGDGKMRDLGNEVSFLAHHALLPLS